jgi:phosphoribosyl-ATP pyrophosphohydrolase/phosphoribosyl-AMP cyclohydrolase
VKKENIKSIIMNIDFKKGNGLVPVVIQDNNTLQVLMVGYMNEEAHIKTMDEGKVTFFSRSKNRLWTKGETSGNFLFVKEITEDCDNDSLLIKVNPAGPVCHTGRKSCFGDEPAKGFTYELESIINQRIKDDIHNSYTNRLFKKGINKVAQKVGEEAVELVIEAKDDNPELFKNEAADLLYHFLILLKTKNITFTDIEEILRSRHKS